MERTGQACGFKTGKCGNFRHGPYKTQGECAADMRTKKLDFFICGLDCKNNGYCPKTVVRFRV